VVATNTISRQKKGDIHIPGFLFVAEVK